MIRSLALALLTVAVVFTPAPAAPQGASRASETQEVRRFVETFLARLGNREVDALDGMLAPKAIIVASREREGRFVNTVQTAEEWLAALRKNPNAAKFEEPLSNVRVTVDSGHLAYLRAAFQVIREGKVVSSGIDHFTLVREPDGWTIVAVAYTSLPAVATR